MRDSIEGDDSFATVNSRGCLEPYRHVADEIQYVLAHTIVEVPFPSFHHDSP